MIKFVISGIAKLHQEGIRISKLKKKIPEEVMRICNSTGNKMVRTTKTDYILRGSKGNRKALPVNPTKLTSRSGDLSSSINAQVNQSGNTTDFKFGTWVKYGKVHELGLPVTVGKKKKTTFNMPKRPFLQPSFDKHLPDFRDKLNSMFERLYGVQ